ncbi:hypothetical protein [Sulfurimonas paralvinellae]|uniref:General glycosylation pathway protein n=1 Tax=Sulfurimonas paralvinellae TaxID=317658 RepID=A0A7M1BBV9_9BACT|nr:hypothetical protein [Sulfurimonas paralvinellae]QOP46272.1 hypothetical protein FM071_08195 [Sulfurimonas paralvinellae]
MKEIVTIYKKQYAFIENSLSTMIESIDLAVYSEMVEKSIFQLYPALRATYIISKDLRQSTPLYTKDETDTTYLGSNKKHLLERIRFRDDDIYISNVYVNSRSATPYLTVVRKYKDEYYVFDFELYTLLKELSMIEGNEYFSKYTKAFYSFFGFLLSFLSLLLIVYAFSSIWEILSRTSNDVLAGIFHSIIALTLALAIFDLSKTILEHEVFYKSLSRNNNLENRLLARFFISIIIALSIEALLVVFKIVLKDYTQMLQAFYLIGGIGVMMASLSLFIFVMRYSAK